MKTSYAALEPEPLGINKVLCKFSTIAALFLLDYTLTNAAKLNKALQAKHLDLTLISTLVDAALESLDDAILPAANWVLELLECSDDIQKAIGEVINTTKIQSFQESAARPYIAHLKENISSRFSSSQEVISALEIFNPHKVPGADSPSLASYGNESVKTLLDHYGQEKPAQTVLGEETVKPALISPDVQTEWRTFRSLLAKMPEDDTASQLKELVTNEMLSVMFPNLYKMATICLTIPVSTASVERSFSKMKLIKTRLRNSLGEYSLSHLMKISIESPEKLTDGDLQEIVDVWYRKSRRIAV